MRGNATSTPPVGTPPGAYPAARRSQEHRFSSKVNREKREKKRGGGKEMADDEEDGHDEEIEQSWRWPVFSFFLSQTYMLILSLSLSLPLSLSPPPPLSLSSELSYHPFGLMNEFQMMRQRSELNASISKELKMRDGAENLLRALGKAKSKKDKAAREEVLVTLSFVNARLQVAIHNSSNAWERMLAHKCFVVLLFRLPCSRSLLRCSNVFLSFFLPPRSVSSIASTLTP